MNRSRRRLVYSSIVAALTTLCGHAGMIGGSSVNGTVTPAPYATSSLLVDGELNKGDFSADEMVSLRNSLSESWSEDTRVVGLVYQSNKLAGSDSTADVTPDSVSEATPGDGSDETNDLVNSAGTVIGEVVDPANFSATFSPADQVSPDRSAAVSPASLSGWTMAGSMWLGGLLAAPAGITVWRRRQVTMGRVTMRQ